MTTLRLYDGGGHRNLLLENFAAGSLAVGSNQHLIIDGDEAMILDPGGHKIYSKVRSRSSRRSTGPCCAAARSSSSSTGGAKPWPAASI